MHMQPCNICCVVHAELCFSLLDQGHALSLAAVPLLLLLLISHQTCGMVFWLHGTTTTAATLGPHHQHTDR